MSWLRALLFIPTSRLRSKMFCRLWPLLFKLKRKYVLTKNTPIFYWTSFQRCTHHICKLYSPCLHIMHITVHVNWAKNLPCANPCSQWTILEIMFDPKIHLRLGDSTAFHSQSSVIGWISVLWVWPNRHDSGPMRGKFGVLFASVIFAFYVCIVPGGGFWSWKFQRFIFFFLFFFFLFFFFWGGGGGGGGGGMVQFV